MTAPSFGDRSEHNQAGSRDPGTNRVPRLWPVVVMACLVLCALAPRANGQSALGLTLEGNLNDGQRVNESTLTPKLAELYSIAIQTAQDVKQERQIKACEDIMQSPEVPADLKRWACFQRIMLLAFTDRNWEAVEVGENWLKESTDDVSNLRLRCALLNILTGRVFPKERKPTVADIERIGEPMFAKGDANGLEMGWAHRLYAQGLTLRAGPNPSPELLKRVQEHARKADEILKPALANPKLLSEYASKRNAPDPNPRDYLVSGTDPELLNLTKKVREELKALIENPPAQAKREDQFWFVAFYRERPRSKEDLDVLHKATERALKAAPPDWFSVMGAFEIARAWPADPEMAKFARRVITAEKPPVISDHNEDALRDALTVLARQKDADSIALLGECARGTAFGSKPFTCEGGKLSPERRLLELQCSAVIELGCASPELAIPVLEGLQKDFPPIQDSSLQPIQITTSPEPRIRSAIASALQRQHWRSEGLSDKQIEQRLFPDTSID